MGMQVDIWLDYQPALKELYHSSLIVNQELTRAEFEGKSLSSAHIKIIMRLHEALMEQNAIVRELCDKITALKDKKQLEEGFTAKTIFIPTKEASPS